jgi:dTDP-4-amino-4,6-dideoxygalactose transaminase
MIPITKPFLPSLEEYQAYIKQVWDRNWLTNDGPLVNELELRLKEFLNIDHLLFLNNGTVALQFAIKAFELQGEIITTPFTFIATTSSIVWEGCIPVYVDIEPETLNIDPAKMEEAITDKTVAILATHTYGNPCNIEAIQQIADRHQLKVIYDAAHCFGTKYKGKSVFSYGDISATSFHATKLFHTVEGGAVFTRHAQVLKKMAYMRNFGHNGPDDFAELGINGKNSEMHAAMGLVNLKYFDIVLESRRKQFDRYNWWMQHMKVRGIRITDGAEFNYAYYPIIFETEETLLKVVEMLNGHMIYPRRYFYPSLNTLRYVSKVAAPVCDDLCRRVLCLPLYHNLSIEEIDLICRLILRVQNN